MGQILNLKPHLKNFNTEISELTNLCQVDLEAVNKLILEKLNSKVPLIQEAASYLILSGGI